MVEPVDPFGGGIFDLVDGAPGSAGFDQLGFVQAVDRLRERIIERIPNAANRSRDAGLGETLGEPHRGILAGFNWSSQHLDYLEVWGGVREAAVGGSCVSGADAL